MEFNGISRGFGLGLDAQMPSWAQAMVTIDVHNRDVVGSLRDAKITSSKDGARHVLQNSCGKPWKNDLSELFCLEKMGAVRRISSNQIIRCIILNHQANHQKNGLIIGKLPQYIHIFFPGRFCRTSIGWLSFGTTGWLGRWKEQLGSFPWHCWVVYSHPKRQNSTILHYFQIFLVGSYRNLLSIFFGGVLELRHQLDPSSCTRRRSS